MPLCPPALQYWTEGNISALQILKGASIFETLCSRLAGRLAVGDRHALVGMPDLGFGRASSAT